MSGFGRQLRWSEWSKCDVAASVNSGTRDWNAEEESEAGWLAGVLLISDEAAIRIAKAAQPVASG